MPSLLDRWKPLRALVVGDLILDRYAFGTVERISPEAPIPILRVAGEDARIGGAGNVAANLAALGARTTLIGRVGRDPEGRTLARLARSARVTPRLAAEAGSRTIVKTRFLAHDQQILRADREDPPPAGTGPGRRLRALALSALKDADLLVLSDYAKGTLDDGLAGLLLASARRRRIPVVAGPKRGLARYRGATALSLNLSEACEALGRNLPDQASVTLHGQALRRRLGLGVLLITRGKEGLSCLWEGGAEHVPARARSVYDVTGAGDTVLAVFAAALAGSASPAEAARLANAAGGLVVGKLGAAVVTRTELAAEMLDRRAQLKDLRTGTGPASSKLRTPAQLKPLLAEARRAGRRVVFTNGCFDLVHAGHVKLLEQARALGDRLVVGLNSDRSVRRLKGPGRPLVCERERAALLAGLACVDDVVLFDAETPRSLVLALRPDVLVKGSDYAGGVVVGRREVESWGGRVALVNLLDGASSSRLIARIQALPEAKARRRGHAAPPMKGMKAKGRTA